MSNQKPENNPPHAWVIAQYSTQKLRVICNALREDLSGIKLAGDNRTPSDDIKIKAMEALAVAADHIDRLHQDRGPHIISTSQTIDKNNEIMLIGVDAIGGTWQYMFELSGWLKLNNQVATLPDEKDTH